jgi:hypothetical protein
VLAGPQGVEAEALAELRDLEDALPRGGRLPAFELAEVALGLLQADLHRVADPPPGRAYYIKASSSSRHYTLPVDDGDPHR